MREQTNLAGFEALGLEKLFERETAGRCYSLRRAKRPPAQRVEGFPGFKPVSGDPILQPRLRQAHEQPHPRQIRMRQVSHPDSGRQPECADHEFQFLASESYTRVLTPPHDKRQRTGWLIEGEKLAPLALVTGHFGQHGPDEPVGPFDSSALQQGAKESEDHQRSKYL